MSKDVKLNDPGEDSDPRLWVANLDAEEIWAPGTASTLPRKIRRRLAAIGSLLRFASPGMKRQGDALWLPAPLEPERLPLYEDRPLPTLIYGSAREALATCPRCRVEPWAATVPWTSQTEQDLQISVNDRRFSYRLGKRWKLVDEAMKIVNDLNQLQDHLRSTKMEQWVVKAPLSAAGRHQLRGTSWRLDSATSSRLKRLFQRHGSLLFEPWHDRDLDIGALFEVDSDGAGTPPELHRQHIDSRGAVTAIEIGESVNRVVGEGLAPLVETASRVAATLSEAGYRGPAGIDAWRHRTDEGRQWHQLGEINARCSVGKLARMAIETLAPDAASCRLTIGDADSFLKANEQARARRRRTWPLVLADAQGLDAIWLTEL